MSEGHEFPYNHDISVYSVYRAILDIDSVHQAGKLDGSLWAELVKLNDGNV